MDEFERPALRRFSDREPLAAAAPFGSSATGTPA